MKGPHEIAWARAIDDARKTAGHSAPTLNLLMEADMQSLTECALIPELLKGLEVTARAFHTVWCQPHGRGLFRDCEFDSCVRVRALIEKAKEVSV